jgi:hypothetical protein
MWLAHGHRIDHSTLAAFRKQNKSALKKIHADLIWLAKELGMIKIAELYVDGTRIAANASRFRTMTAEKASKLLDIVQKEIDEYLERTERADQVDDLFDDGTSGEQLPEHLNTLNKRKEQLENIVTTCNEMDEVRKKQGVDPKKNPFQLPLTDQDSRILPNKEGGYAPNYTPIVGVEGELGLIVSAMITNCANEQDYLVTTVDEVEQSYGVSVETVGADAAYSTGPNIVELEETRGKDFLSPHRNGDMPKENPAIRHDPTKPVAEADLDKLPTDPSRGTFSTEAFVYDEDKDVYYCPEGRELTRSYQESRTQAGGQEVTRTIYQSPSCADCPLISRCRKGRDHKTGRRVSRDEYEQARAAHRRKMSTEGAKARYSKRFSVGERPFAQIKNGFGFRRFQTRGDPSVSSEFFLATLAHNLVRLTNHLGSIANLRALIAANQ